MSSLSYTALSELERCGYRYYLERVLELPEDRGAARDTGETKGLGGRTRGVIVHRLLESLDFVAAKAPSADDVAVLASELGVKVAPAERAELAALLARASSSPLAQRLAGAPRIRRELPFAFSLGLEQPLVTGVIDAAMHDLGGDLLIVDYKSDRIAAEEDLERLVEQVYGIQRWLYALAGLRDGAHEVEVVHWFLERPAECVAARFGAEDRGPLERRLRVAIEQAQARGFAVSATPHRALCLTCPGRAGMCSWGTRIHCASKQA